MLPLDLLAGLHVERHQSQTGKSASMCRILLRREFVELAEFATHRYSI